MPASALFETFKPPLVSCEWLSANLNRQDLALFDATFYLPRQNRSGFQEYRQGHLPGALFFDIDAVADLESPLPHTLPSPGKFGRMMGEFGVDDLSTVVVYDDNAFFASARAWWMFRVFGHDRVFVLDGGLRRWKALNLPLQSEIPKPAAKKFISRFRPHLFCDLERMKKNCASGEFLIVDSRSAESYHGRNLPGGSKAEPSHIPGSINVPYAELRNADTGLLLSPDALSRVFLARSTDISRPIVATCGSGVSAAVLALALFRAGSTEVPVYDGSWSEWSRQAELPHS